MFEYMQKAQEIASEGFTVREVNVSSGTPNFIGPAIAINRKTQQVEEIWIPLTEHVKARKELLSDEEAKRILDK